MSGLANELLERGSNDELLLFRSVKVALGDESQQEAHGRLLTQLEIQR